MVRLNFKEGRGRSKGTDEQPLSDKPPMMQCGKRAVPGSSNLKSQHKVLCYRSEKNSVNFVFLN